VGRIKVERDVVTTPGLWFAWGPGDTGLENCSFGGATGILSLTSVGTLSLAAVGILSFGAVGILSVGAVGGLFVGAVSFEGISTVSEGSTILAIGGCAAFISTAGCVETTGAETTGVETTCDATTSGVSRMLIAG
jgi:hypothetical protein